MGGEARSRRRNPKRKHPSASAGGEILRLKKEALAAVKAAAAARHRLSAIRPMAEPAQRSVAAGAGKKKKKVVKTRVTQAHIDCLKACPYKVAEIPEDELANHCEDFRDRYAEQRVIADKIFAYQRALLDQYEANGYAEDESEVSDYEEDEVEAAN